MPGGGKKNKGNEGENSVEMGKKVKPAWEEDNTLRKRSCTDLPCLLFFLAFIGGMVRKAEVDPGEGVLRRAPPVQFLSFSCTFWEKVG